MSIDDLRYYKIGFSLIDLSQIRSIEGAWFVDEMGRGGYFVKFIIEFKLHSEPIKFEYGLKEDEYDIRGNRNHKILVIDPEDKEKHMIETSCVLYSKKSYQIVAVNRLNESVVSPLIKAWKYYNKTVAEIINSYRDSKISELEARILQLESNK